MKKHKSPTLLIAVTLVAVIVTCYKQARPDVVASPNLVKAPAVRPAAQSSVTVPEAKSHNLQRSLRSTAARIEADSLRNGAKATSENSESTEMIALTKGADNN